MKSRQQNTFNFFEDNDTETTLFCPVCEEELVQYSLEYMSCSNCKKEIPKKLAKDDVSIEYIFGIKGD